MSRRTLPHLLSTALFAMSLPLWFGALMMLLSTSSTTIVLAALPNTPIVVWTYTIYYTSGPAGTNPNVTQMFLDKYGYNRTQVLDEYRFKFSTLGDIMANMSLAAVSPVSGGSRSPPPPPDVILGIDMLQMYKPNITFKPFTLTNAADLLPNVDRNGPANNVVPADLGSINIVYDELDYPDIAKVANLFSYEKLVESCLIDELIVIEPTEATGEHFLMATIALYGDPDRGLNGLYPASYGGWKGWWRRAFQSGMYVAEDWDAAFYPFSDDATPYAMMVSYGTDSAYNECFGYNETRIRPLPHVDASGTAWTWNMYETNGVTTYATADKDAVIRQLLDFMFSPPIQNLTYEHLYMAPVNTRSLTLPACFAKGDPLLPNEASWLNTILYDHGSQEAKLTQYFSTWKTEWYALWQSTRNSTRTNTARFSTCTASDVQRQFTGQTVSSAPARFASMGNVVSLILAVIVAIASTVVVLA